MKTPNKKIIYWALLPLCAAMITACGKISNVVVSPSNPLPIESTAINVTADCSTGCGNFDLDIYGKDVTLESSSCLTDTKRAFKFIPTKSGIEKSNFTFPLICTGASDDDSFSIDILYSKTSSITPNPVNAMLGESVTLTASVFSKASIYYNATVQFYAKSSNIKYGKCSLTEQAQSYDCSITIPVTRELAAESRIYTSIAGLANSYTQVNITAPGPSKTSKIIFVSASTFSGNLGGLSGADAKCNADANKPAGSGSYKALLGGNNATTTGITYTRTDGTTTIAVATGGDLVGYNALESAISISAIYSVWTGGAGNNCSNWSSALSTDFGDYGNPRIVNDGMWWYYSGGSGSIPVACNGSNPLYCVQQ